MTLALTDLRRMAPPMTTARGSARARDELESLTEHCAMLLREQPGPLPAGLHSELERAYRERKRPRFDDPRDYVRYASECFARGKMPFEPETVQEYRALAVEFREQTRRHFWRSPDDLERMGLPRWLLDEIDPFDDYWKEKFLETV